jgi:O-antigen/teichoic acid export membrane protein
MSRALTLFVGGAAAAVGNIATGMIAARYLSKPEYATFRQTFLMYEILSPIFMMGLPMAIYVLLARGGSSLRGMILDNVSSLFVSSIFLCVIIAIVWQFDLLQFAGNSNLHRTIGWLMVYTVGMLPATLFVPVMVTLGKVKIATIYNILFSLTLSIGVGLSVLLTSSYEAPVASRALVPIFFLPVMLVLMLRGSSGALRLPRPASMLSMTRYALPLGVATMLGGVTVQMHTAIVAALCTPAEFAVYANGAAELPLVGIVTGSIMAVLLGDMAAASSRGDYSEAVRLFRRAAVTSASILFPCMFFFLVTAREFMVVMYSEKYIDSAVPFMIYLGILPARIIVYGAAMTALGMNREILVRSFVDLLLNVAITWVLVSWLGYIGAAVGLIVTLYVWTIPFNLFILSRKLELRWTNLVPWRSLGIICVICASAAAALLLWRWQIDLGAPWGFLVETLLYAVIVIPLLLYLGYLNIPFSMWPRTSRKRGFR